jgi:hypothetical protein
MLRLLQLRQSSFFKIASRSKGLATAGTATVINKFLEWAQNIFQNDGSQNVGLKRLSKSYFP